MNPNLVKAKLAVMRTVGYVQKHGKMTAGGSYTYAKEGDFIFAIRPAMLDAGLTFAPVGCETVTTESFDRANGGKSFRVVVKRTFRLSHESGEHEDIVTLGEGIDVGDKACNKAMTAAKKYALREAFLIETGDDPDDTPSHVQQQTAAKGAGAPHNPGANGTAKATPAPAVYAAAPGDPDNARRSIAAMDAAKDLQEFENHGKAATAMRERFTAEQWAEVSKAGKRNRERLCGTPAPTK